MRRLMHDSCVTVLQFRYNKNKVMRLIAVDRHTAISWVEVRSDHFFILFVQSLCVSAAQRVWVSWRKHRYDNARRPLHTQLLLILQMAWFRAHGAISKLHAHTRIDQRCPRRRVVEPLICTAWLHARSGRKADYQMTLKLLQNSHAAE